MRQLLFLLVICVLFALVQMVPTRNGHNHHHHQRRHFNQTRRIHRQIPHYPQRNEEQPGYCTQHEHHVLCGQERHCDKSCDNMYSPPNCFHDSNNPKCYFPRCLCNEGFVRSPSGHCIRPNRCPNRYSEPENDDNEILIDFKPMRFRHSKVRRVRHRKPTHLW